MREAFKAITRAKREAQQRQRQYEQDGVRSEHKLPAVRHAIKELDDAYQVLLDELMARNERQQERGK
jgi:hypothetical protein